MSIWDKYPDYSPEELRTLTSVASATLIDCCKDAGITTDVLRLSSKSAAIQLKSLLQQQAPDIQSGQIQAALEDPEQAHQIAVVVLGQIRDIPLLAERVDKAYQDRNREMAGPEMLLLAGAIVILAMKVKTLEITKEGVRTSFYDAGNAVKSFVVDLVKSVVPGV